MAALPTSSLTVDAIYRWRADKEDSGHRPHLGASLIGKECARALWYTFRWCDAEKFEGRILRLFDTGKREEARVYEELRGIGCEVYSDDGTAQFRVAEHGGHFGGSMDGVVVGIPEAPKTPHVLEIKTHSAKSFKEVVKKGVQVAKPQHFAQMQAYMALVNLDRALYFAVNKDTDEVYTERVEHDPLFSGDLLIKAKKIITAVEPPLGISDDPEHFECNYCHFNSICHGTAAPEVNCRTCMFSTPELDGEAEWTCGKESGRHAIPLTVQRAGCTQHRYIPPLLAKFGEAVDAVGDGVEYQMPDGTRFVNGATPGAFASAEIRAGGVEMIADKRTHEVKAAVPSARVVERTAFSDMPSDTPWEYT